MDDQAQRVYLKEVNDFSDLFYNKNNTNYSDITFTDFNHYQKVYNNRTFNINSLNKNNINNIINWLKDQSIIDKEFKNHIKNQFLVNSGIIPLDESFNIFNIYLLAHQQNQHQYRSNQNENQPLAQISSSSSSSSSSSHIITLPAYISISNITKSIKYFSVVYFLIYHQHKMAHYIFEDYFINYIACVFFDQDIEVFSLLKFLNIIKTGKSLYNLLNTVLFDSKLNWFMENNKNQLLKEKIQILFNLIDNKQLFDKLVLLESSLKLNNNQIEFIKILKQLVDNKKNSGIIISNNISNDLELKVIDYQKKRQQSQMDQHNNNNSKSNTNHIIEQQPQYFNHNIYLNNIILGKIMDYIIYNDCNNFNNSSSGDNSNKYFYDRDSITINISYGLVSKRLFSVFSKVISMYPFPIFNKINYNSENCLVKYPPLYLNYESIKYLPSHQIEYSFSRVEEMFIRLDNNQQIERQYLDNISYIYKTRYQERDYLIYPPSTPNLKRLVISNYYGYNNISNAGFFNRAYNQINANDLITQIVSNTSKASIKYFTISIIRNFQHDANIPFIYDLSFFTHLLQHHSETLKEISIHFSLNFTPRTVESPNFIEYYFTDFPHIKIKFISNDESIPSTFKKNIKNYFNNKLIQEQVISNVTFYKSSISG